MTPKQKLFIAEYLVDLNATQAAIRAGYSAKTAGQIGDENLKKPEIAKAIAEAQKERLARVQLNADYVLMRLHEIESIDDAILYDDDGNLKAIAQLPEHVRRSLGGVKLSRYKHSEDGEGETSVIEIKRESRLKALELMGRHVDVQAFKDQLEHTMSESLAERLLSARQRREG